MITKISINCWKRIPRLDSSYANSLHSRPMVTRCRWSPAIGLSANHYSLGPMIAAGVRPHKRWLDLNSIYLINRLSHESQSEGKLICWKCGHRLPIDRKVSIFCDNCRSIQALNWGINYFDLLNQNVSFDVNLIDLNKAFISLQMATHPDKYSNTSNTEHTISMDNSSLINKAYKTLRNPYERGLYLLNILSGNQIGEDDMGMDTQFLMDIMKVNEDIEDNSKSKQKLQIIFKDNEKNMNDIMDDISQAFGSTDYTNAKLLLSKFKFYITLDLNLKEKLHNFQ